MSTTTKLTQSFASGLAGAATLTAIHQTARRFLDDAPRMDLAGKRAIAKGMNAAGTEPPKGQAMERVSLVSELASNTLYYAFVGHKCRGSLARGAMMGSLAGLGAIYLTPKLGLGRRPAGIKSKTKAMTFAWYLIGGLAAAAACRAAQALDCCSDAE